MKLHRNLVYISVVITLLSLTGCGSPPTPESTPTPSPSPTPSVPFHFFGTITNKSEVQENFSEKSYLQLIPEIGSSTELDMTDDGFLLTSQLPQIPLTPDGHFDFQFETIEPGRYNIVVQLFSARPQRFVIPLIAKRTAEADTPVVIEILASQTSPYLIDLGEVVIISPDIAPKKLAEPIALAHGEDKWELTSIEACGTVYTDPNAQPWSTTGVYSSVSGAFFRLTFTCTTHSRLFPIMQTYENPFQSIFLTDSSGQKYPSFTMGGEQTDSCESVWLIIHEMASYQDQYSLHFFDSPPIDLPAVEYSDTCVYP